LTAGLTRLNSPRKLDSFAPYVPPLGVWREEKGGEEQPRSTEPAGTARRSDTRRRDFDDLYSAKTMFQAARRS